MDDFEQCLFCRTTFPAGAGSPEHVFLSCIGGRVVTKRAICGTCNNAFSSSETGSADQALRNMLLVSCNALNIASGRRDPAPTVERAYEASPGVFYDLAPGLVPMPRGAQIPKTEAFAAGNFPLSAANRADALRVQKVLAQRARELEAIGLQASIGEAKHVTWNLPPFVLSFSFDIQSAARCVAKTAVVAASLLYGNAVASRLIDSALRTATRTAPSDMQPWVSFAYETPWVELASLQPHPETPAATTSGFEHSVAFIDIGGRWVAFVEFFGAYRFTVNLGPQSGLPARALIVNPRATTKSLLLASVFSPKTYVATTAKLIDQAQAAVPHLRAAVQSSLEECYRTGLAAKAAALGEELLAMLGDAGSDPLARAAALTEWSHKLETVESGREWSEPVDFFVNPAST